MNKNDSHMNRMRWLHAVAAPLEGTPEFDRLRKDFEVNPEAVKREAAKRYKVAQASVRAQLNGGAGDYSDEALRYFLMQYNYRAWNYGLRRLPMSFNVLEPFFDYDPEHIRFRLLPEIDYRFSIEDFLDFATQPATPDANVVDAMKLEERVVYNYSVSDDPTALVMQMDSAADYVVAGVSLLRRGSELTVLLVAGEKAQPGALKVYKEEDFIDYSGVKVEESNPVEPVRLSGAPDYVQAYVACRFNIDSRELQVRYLMLDAGRHFVVHTDDPHSLTPLSEDKISAQLNASNKILEQRATLFELAKTAVLLPSYVHARAGKIEEEIKVTALAKQAKKSLKVRRALEAVPLDSKIFSRRVSTIDMDYSKSETPAATGRAYTAPEFKTVKGFWRTFRDPTRTGRDESGNPIVGKTWVKSHARRAGPSEQQNVVYIKSPVGYRDHPVENYRKRVSRAKASRRPTTPAPAPGYLYVLRSPAHGLDIYKIGYTDRDPESRARELSSTTGSPVHFLVVQAWAVIDGRAAEAAAHKALASDRLATNREFFIGTYSVLREKIEAAIDSFLLEKAVPVT